MDTKLSSIGNPFEFKFCKICNAQAKIGSDYCGRHKSHTHAKKDSLDSVELQIQNDDLLADNERLRAALEKSVQHIEQLCRTTNTLSNKLELGDKVRAVDFTDVARAALKGDK